MKTAWIGIGLAAVGLGAQIGAAAMHAGLLATVIIAVRRRAWFADRPLWTGVLSVIGAALLHALIGLEPPHWSYSTFPRYLLIIPIVAALAAGGDEAVRRRALAWGLGLGALSALYGIGQVVFETVGPLAVVHSEESRRLFYVHRPAGSALTFFSGGLRATGMVHHILAFGHIGAMLALAGAAVAIWSDRVRLRLFAVGLALLCAFGVLLSGARAGLLGLMLGLGVLGLLRVAGSLRRALVWGVALVVFGAGLTAIVAPERVSGVASLTGRQPIWEHARGRIADSFPRGLGYGSYPDYAAKTYPTIPVLDGKRTAWAHNSWLSLMVEAPLAAVAWLLLWLLLLRRALDGFDSQPVWGGILAASLLAWLLISMFHDSHFQRVYAPFSFWLWGLCLGGLRASDLAPCTDQ